MAAVPEGKEASIELSQKFDKDVGADVGTPEAKEPKAQRGNLFRFAGWKEWLLIVISAIAGLGSGVLLPVFMLIFGDLINDLGEFQPIPCPGGGETTTTTVGPPGQPVEPPDYVYYTKVQAIIGGISFVLGWIGATCMELAAERQQRTMRTVYLKAILRQEMGWFDTFDSGTLSSRLNENIVLIRDGLGVKFSQLFQFFATLVSGVVIGLVKGWKLGLVTIATLPLVAGAGFFMMRALNTSGEMEKKAYGEAGSVAEEAFSSIRTVVAFGSEQRTLSRYKQKLQQGLGMRGVMAQGFGMGTMMGVLFLTYALGFWYGGKLVADSMGDCPDCFQGGTALTVFFCIVIGAFVLGQAGPNVSSIMKGASAAGDLCRIIDRESKIDPYSTEGLRDVEISGDLVFKGVKFAYPTRGEKPVFSNLDLHIPAGKSVALVGGSGCGKSTVTQLIQRFYDPEGGSVMIDGRDLRDYNIEWIRSQMSIVSQEPRLFDNTIAENIRMGRISATRKEIEAAAASSNAANFINDFPKKFDTQVGESGGQLSGGQKQRIAIARAVIRDPKILILDEATSALDNESEKIVQKTLDDLIQKSQRTTVIIAHRLTTVQNADIICVLDNTSGLGATVVEKGTHKELMAIQNGIYYNLVQSQSMPESEQLRQQEAERIAEDLGISKQHSRTVSRASSMRSRNPQHSGSQKSIGQIADAMSGKQVVEYETKYGCCKVKKKEPHPRPAPSFFRVMKVLGPEWWKVLLGAIGALLNGAVFPVFSIIFSKFIGTYFIGDPECLMREARKWSLVFVALGVYVFLVMSMQTLFFEWAGQRLMHRLRVETFEAMLRQDMAFFDSEENSTGTLSSILSSDIRLVKGWVSDNTGILISNVFAAIFAIIIAFVAEPRLAAVVLAGALVMAPAAYLEMRAMKGTTEANSAAAETPGFVLNEAIANVRVVTSFCLQPEMISNYADVLESGFRAGRRNAILFGFFFGFSQFAQFGVQALAYWYGFKLVVDGVITNIERMMMAIFALIFAAMGFGQSAVFGTDSSKARDGARNVYYVLDRQPAIDIRDESGLTDPVDGKVGVLNINFRYPARPDVPVYKNLTFNVDPGKTVALVGASGCGKSTVVQLLERFYDVDSVGNERVGGISLDGNDLRSLQLKHLRASLGLVSQEPVLFDTTIRENILYGRTDASDEDVVNSAKMANAHNFIMEFPDGYDTQVGKGGGKLSGGQKQRISIARAMIRDPKILLLDEATSALDAESERIVQEALDSLLKAKERTTIVIAHRLSTVRNADKIVVLSNADKAGSVVVEEGTHAELVAKSNGVYANLVRIALAAGDA